MPYVSKDGHKERVKSTVAEAFGNSQQRPVLWIKKELCEAILTVKRVPNQEYLNGIERGHGCKGVNVVLTIAAWFPSPGARSGGFTNRDNSRHVIRM